MSDNKSVSAEPSTNRLVDTKRVRRLVDTVTFWFTCVVLPPTAVSAGSVLLWRNFTAAGPEFLMRYVFGERDVEPLRLQRDVANPADPGADLASDIHDVVAVDWLVILGYFLLLLTCAVVFMASSTSFSNSARKLSYAMLGAVVVAATTDIVENFLILRSTNPGLLNWLPDRFWVVGPAALATVKWCTLIVAIFAVPAAVVAVWRLIVANMTRRMRRDGPDWWDGAPIVPPPKHDQTDAESTWRQAYYVPDANELLEAKNGDAAVRAPTALCLSGGGIRSGCVAMGAMQTLAHKPDDDEPPKWDGAPLLDKFDYIISVSGGGYTAGARLLAVQEKEGGAVCDLADRFHPGSPEFGFLRQRSSYIADSPIGLVRALAEVLKNLVASLLMVFLVAVIFGGVFGWFVARLPLAAFVPSWEAGSLPPVHLPSLDNHLGVVAVAVAIPAAFALILGAGALFCEYISTEQRSTVVKERLGQAAGAATLLALLIFAVTVALPGLMWLCAPLSLTADHKLPSVAAFGGLAAVVVLQYGATIVSMVTSKKDGFAAGQVSRLRRVIPPGVVQLGTVLLALTVLAVAWLLVVGIAAAQVFDQVTRDPENVTHVPRWEWILGGITAVVVILSCVDVTSLSLHPFYRRRLARALAVRRIQGVAEGYDPKEPTWLHKYGRAKKDGPKFVFAAAAALTGDAKPAPGLNAVSYVLSADYIGGPALGWLNTEKMVAVAPSRIKRDLTVQAAMAISGAAFASAMGRLNKGFESLLAVSGARLGTWLPNPTFVRYAKDHATDGLYPKALPSVRGAGYFYRELFGINRHDARLVQVTDGGHYENLGLVEALRRRCRLIYVIDGGGDTPPLLTGLSDAIRLARYELGVEILLDEDGEFGVCKLAPGSAEPFGTGHAFHSLNSRLTAGAVLRGTIKYPSAADLKYDTGLLIVAKAVLWRGLPDWVLTYGAGKGGENFPHDKTSDQWFNEAQFAAYTEIGRRIAMKAREVATTQ